MPDMKTILIYDMRKVPSDVIDAIANTPDGGFLGMEPDFFGCFKQVTFSQAAVDELQAEDKKKRPRTGKQK